MRGKKEGKIKRIAAILIFVFLAITLGSGSVSAEAPKDKSLKKVKMEYRGSLKNESRYYKLSGDSLLNPKNSILKLDNYFNLISFNLFSNISWGDILNGHINLHAFYDNTEHDSLDDIEIKLNELSLNFSPKEYIELIVGKRIFRWGTGYAWNPTGVAEPLKNPRDPSDRLETSSGLEMVELCTYLGSSTLTIVALPDSDFTKWDRTEWVAKIYSFVEGFDLALITKIAKEEKNLIGFNFSKVIGNRLELHGEIAGKKGSENLYLETKSNECEVPPGSGMWMPAIYEFSQSKKDEHSPYYKFVLGSHYTFLNGINLCIEYYHNDEGYNDSEWQESIEYLKYSNKILDDSKYLPIGERDAGEVYLLQANANLDKLTGVRQNYLFFRGYFPRLGVKGDLEILFINCLDDGSSILIPTFTYNPLPNLGIYLTSDIFFGNDESEFGLFYSDYTISLGLRLYF